MSHNPAFIRTEKAIIRTFMDLIKQKPFEKITVQDILDQTPVTRATFYAHFHDKYEIAEKLQEEFIRLRNNVRVKLQTASLYQSHAIQHKSMLDNRELVETLLNIHTEKVNIRKIIKESYEQYYLTLTNSPNNLVEAQIYAQARTEFEFAVMYHSDITFSFKDSNDIFLNVSLHLLRLADDPEVREFLNQKLLQKFPSLKHSI